VGSTCHSDCLLHWGAALCPEHPPRVILFPLPRGSQVPCTHTRRNCCTEHASHATPDCLTADWYRRQVLLCIWKYRRRLSTSQNARRVNCSQREGHQNRFMSPDVTWFASGMLRLGCCPSCRVPKHSPDSYSDAVKELCEHCLKKMTKNA